MRIPFQRSVLVALVASATLLQACSEQPEPAREDNKAAAPAAPEQHAAHEAEAPKASGITRSTAPEGARVFFVSPEDGATVSSPVTVEFGLEGMDVAPAGTDQENSGHHHLLIDDPEIDTDRPLPATDQVVHFGKAQTETEIELTPGEHTLQLILGDWKHQPTDPVVKSDTITITVSEGDAVE